MGEQGTKSVATTGARGTWLPYGPPDAKARLRFFCLPHAGAGAAAFGEWRGVLGRGVEVLPVELPGRGGRREEQPHQDMDTLVGDLAEGLSPWLDAGPYALFGHSMGALICYELAHHLLRTGRPAPQRLVVSAHRAPDRRWPGYTDDPDDDIPRLLAVLAGPDADPSAPVRPVLRADLTMCARYDYRPRPPFAVPVTALGGADDPLVPRQTLDAWRTHTSAAFTSTLLPGGHFYLFDHQRTVSGILRSRLRAARSPAAGR